MAATSAAHISSYTPSAAAINGAFCPNKFVITSCTNASRLAATAAATALEGSGWTVAAEEAGPVTGMMPGMASAAKGTGAYAGPRYGFKPTVMPKQVVV